MRIREVRKSKGLTLKQVAEEASVEESTVSRWETEPHRLTYPILVTLAKILNCRIVDLLDEENSRNLYLPVLGSDEDKTVIDAYSLASFCGIAVSGISVFFPYDDTMAPTFSIGDMVIVDAKLADPAKGGVYALQAEDAVVLRRLNLSATHGLVHIAVDNPLYAACDPVKKDDIRIIGNVVGVIKKL